MLSFRLVLLFGLFTSSVLSGRAQVYDGDLDSKIFLGYSTVGGSPAVDLKWEDGFGDYVSMGWCFQYLLTNSSKVYYDSPKVDRFIERFEPGISFNGHFFQSLITEANVDIYTGIYISFKSLALQAGAKYNFSERFGIYAHVQQGFSNSAFGEGGDILNRYGKKLIISGGLTFSII